jgi:hypothetical protein
MEARAGIGRGFTFRFGLPEFFDTLPCELNARNPFVNNFLPRTASVLPKIGAGSAPELGLPCDRRS